MKHELGHYLIEQGRIDPDEVRTKLKETIDEGKLDSAAKLYAEAYQGSGLSPEEIWKECICDSLGDMNIFANEADVGEFMGEILPEIKNAAAENSAKSPTQTRGSPDGKASRETKADAEEDIDYDEEDIDAIRAFSTAIDEVMTCSDEYALSKTRTDTFRILAHTPKIILNNVKGAKNLPIDIRFDALYLAARESGILNGNYHNLGKNILENIHFNISNPDAIVRMKNGRINIFANIQTEKGSTGVISIELDTPIAKENSYKDRYNLVITIFAGKDNYIRNNLLKNGDYVEYEKSDLSQVNSQLHEWMAIINDKSLSNIISRKSDLSSGIDENNSSGGQYSRELDIDGQSITMQSVKDLREILKAHNIQGSERLSINQFTSEDIKKAEPWARKFYAELGTKSPFFRAWFGDWRAYDKEKNIGIHDVLPLNLATKNDAVNYIKDGLKNKTLFRGNIHNDDIKSVINIGAQVYNDTLIYANRRYSRDNDFVKYCDSISLLQDIKSIVSDSILLDTDVANLKLDKDGKELHPNRAFIHYLYTVKRIDNRCYLVKLVVDELLSNDTTTHRAYSVDEIEISPVAVSQVLTPADTTSDISGGISTSTISIADLHGLVKQFDKEFSPKDVNPILLNEDGTPKVFYHGTDGDFNSFSREKRGSRGKALNFGMGFYFTPKKSIAENYTSTDNVMSVCRL